MFDFFTIQNRPLRLVAAALLLAGFFPWRTVQAGETTLRVEILKAVRNFEVMGKNLQIIDGQNGTVYLRVAGREVTPIAFRDLGMTVSGRGIAADKLVLRADDDTFRVSGKTLRGELEVVRHESRGLTLVNHLPLERYLIGLINHEISSKWPPESVKAQAVVARTYALYRKAQNKYVDYDLESTTIDQVYGGSDREDRASLAAVRATEGRVLTYDSDLIAAFYHSCCGGHTELPQHVWGGTYEGLRGVVCNYCTDAPAYYWTYQVRTRDLQDRLRKSGFALSSISQVDILQATPFGRLLTLAVNGEGRTVRLTGNQLRAAAGFGALKSTFIRLAEDGKPLGQDAVLNFVGSGAGHGVGMCQWGARGMGEEGKSYAEILKYYYPDARLSTWRRGS